MEYNNPTIKEQEAAWFKPPTWDLDRRTDEVYIVFKNTNIAKRAFSIVEEFLEFYKFTKVGNSTTKNVIKINIVNKTYEYELSVQSLTSNNRRAVPSQLPPFYEQNKTTLIGRKFGL
jgi:hypothetical protein